MRRVATLLFLLQALLFSATADETAVEGTRKEVRKYTMYASVIDTEGQTVYAKGKIIIYNKEMMFSADEATYDQSRELLTLTGNVLFFYQGKLINRADRLTVDLDRERFRASDIFLKEFTSDIWIKAASLEGDNDNFIMRHASLSSCCVENPEWQIRFSKGHFHKNREYVSLWHPRFYLGGIPLLYLPWIAFPTITERRSGLLRPVIGFENSDNLLFIQPIFIAPSKSWDIQLNPQIRLNRGEGLYTTLRFADTPYSRGEVTLGAFHEHEDYAQRHNLKNSVHRGASFYYRNEALFTRYIKENLYDYKDGLFLDATTLNDIDYINLKDDRRNSVDKLVTSRLNYYISGYGDYIGAYLRYFIDTEKPSNATTLQTLPSLQYHKFSQILGLKNFYYSIDYKFKNSYREEGLGARQHEFSMPFVFTLPMLDQMLNFSISENLYYSRVNYTDGNDSTPNATYFSNYHRFSLTSDLMKRYGDTLHNLQLEMAVTLPSAHHKKGYFADFIPFNLQRKSYYLKANNYLYDQNGVNFLIDRFTQYYYTKKEDERYNEAENEIIYRYSENLTLRNALIYSYAYHKLKKIQSGINYRDDYNSVRIDHTYYNAPDETKIDYISADMSRRLDRRYLLKGGIDYDFDNSFTKEWRLGLQMKKKCWSYEVRYRESVTPSLTSGGTESVRTRGIYLLVTFAHIGGVAYKYIKDETNTQPATVPSADTFPVSRRAGFQ